MANLRWERNRATGSYSSATGRWIISKSDKGWTLEDIKTSKKYNCKSLKTAQEKAEGIFASEEELENKSKEVNFNNFQPVQSRDSEEGFIPVPARILK